MQGIKRDLFPIVKEKPYFNACSIGPLAIPVREAIEQYMANWNDHGGFAWVKEGGWNETIEEARALFAKIIGAKPENIAYSFGNSVAFASVLSAFQFQQGDSLVYNELDFPAFPTYIMARSEGNVDYRVVPERDGTVSAADYGEFIDTSTRMVTACEVSSNTGARIDIEELTELSHDQDVPVFLDSYQSTGAIPMDVKALDVDFLASGCLKWLVGGFGMSFLYIRDDWLEKLDPRAIGWMGVEDPFADLFDRLRTTLHRPITATKFQFGTPYPFGAVTALQGMRLVDSIGIPNIYSYNKDYTQKLLERAVDEGYEVQTSFDPKKRGSIVNIKVPQAEEVVKKLQHEGFILDMRSNGIRLAPHFYNNDNDMNQLFDRLKSLVSL